MSRHIPLVLRACLVFCLLATACARESDYDGSPHKVQVMLGMHANFYHSWRGDTNDEAGFGTDIRIVRAIIEMLDAANAQGLDAKVYWDVENLFTLETILPEYAPDIIENMRRRIEQGRDEVLLMSYSNTLLAAATEDEMRAAVKWSISNPWGSGVRDLFGDFVPILRPQEYTTTTGMGRVLAEEGVEGVILSYSGYPFNATATFLPHLDLEQRYGATWLRFEENGPALVLLPAASIGDVLNQISIERWMLDLRRLQVEGKVDQDLLIHINFDADAESWIPQDLPPGLGWFPNTQGLVEYIDAVNKYEWAEFTTPRRYLKDHEPVGEVEIRRDLADGAFDGHYSWAEKLPSHEIWTKLERARLSGRRAEALLADADAEEHAAALHRLHEGRDSSFFQRLRALSTTHFGMSTPMVNEERQAVAESVVDRARDAAESVEREAALRLRKRPVPAGAVYAFHVRDLRAPASGAVPASTLLRLPVILDRPIPMLRVVDGDGARLRASVVNVEAIGGGQVAAEIWVPWVFSAGGSVDLALVPGDVGAAPDSETGAQSGNDRLMNDTIDILLDEKTGIGLARIDDWQFGGEDFLQPFITYRTGDRPVSYAASGFESLALREERLDGLARARLQGRIPFETPDGEATATVDVDLSLPADAP
ncbi:MAG: hypothetical protein GY946_23110, partial [bacterium]|nr:hypothetical protein [bacterium]